jgi:nitric oxide dioxygenase
MADLDVPTLEHSFGVIAENSNDGQDFVAALYKRLFAEYPQAAALFANTDMARQEKALLGALVRIFGLLRDVPRLVDYLTELGARHNQYGVRDEHYPMVGAALMDTLREFAGSAWEEPRWTEAWTNAYGTIAHIMSHAGREAAEAQG